MGSSMIISTALDRAWDFVLVSCRALVRKVQIGFSLMTTALLRLALAGRRMAARLR